MDHNQFLEAYNLIKENLINEIMDRTYNSIGSNIFFEFGKQKEVVFQNNKKSLQKEWAIWLSWTSWRITQYHKYVIGSGESSEIHIQDYLEKLLGKRILSFRFLSQFLDLEINFEDGYQVTTFFNFLEENQWVVFISNNTKMVIDCSTQKAVESVQELSKNIEIANKYKNLHLFSSNIEIKELLFAENKFLKIVCSENFSIDLGLSAWRIEKDGQYQMGRKDYYFSSTEIQTKKLEDQLLNLIKKKIKYIGLDSSGTDVRLEFQERYILEIYAHARADQWKITHNGEVFLHANMGF